MQDLTAKEGTQGRTLTVPLPAKGKAALDLSVLDPESRRVLCYRQFSVVLDCLPLKVELLRPHYQNAIFAEQKLDAIDLDVAVALDPDERRDYQFELVLRSDREILRHQETMEAARTVTLSKGRHDRAGRDHLHLGSRGVWLRLTPPQSVGLRRWAQTVQPVDSCWRGSAALHGADDLVAERRPDRFTRTHD